MPTVGSLPSAVDAWLTPRRAVTASVLSIVAVALVAATPNSPFHPALPVQAETGGPMRMVAGLFLLTHLSNDMLVMVGLAAMIAAGASFLLVLRACSRGLLPVRTVITLAVAYQVVVLLLPLLLSRDVFSYAYYGRIVSRYGGNPYVQVPANFPQDPLSRFIWPDWRNTPSVYGPLFVWLAAAITAVFHSIPGTIVAFKLVAVGAMVGSMAIVRSLVDRVNPRRTAYAVAMIGLNPIMIFHTAGGGHVDALVMLSVAAAIWLVVAKRELTATAALTLGALVKVTAAVPLVLMLVYLVARTERGKRLGLLAKHLGLAVGISLVAALPFLQRANPTLGMLDLIHHDSWMAPPELMERLFEAIGRGVAGSVGGSIGVDIARMAVFGTLAFGLFMIGKQVARRAQAGADALFLGAAWGWSLILMMLVSPTLFPWYFAWVIPIAWMLPRVPRRTLELACAVLVASQLEVQTFQLPGWLQLKLVFGHPLLIALLVWFGVDLWKRLRGDVPLDAEVIPDAVGPPAVASYQA
ncbi:MAG: glycosyltransferase 87 family protein [Actinomycetota bacterium]|nr:glycosyltransferase 87 family protein [Actinomycetota bacterium]